MSGFKLPIGLHWVLERRSWKDLHTVGSHEKLQANSTLFQSITGLWLLFHMYPPTKILMGNQVVLYQSWPLVARDENSLVSLYCPCCSLLQGTVASCFPRFFIAQPITLQTILFPHIFLHSFNLLPCFSLFPNPYLQIQKYFFPLPL